MENWEPDYITVFLPRDKDSQVRIKITNGAGDAIAQRVLRWDVDASPNSLAYQVMSMLLAHLARCHGRDFGF